jgi:hypothetical protein
MIHCVHALVLFIFWFYGALLVIGRSLCAFNFASMPKSDLARYCFRACLEPCAAIAPGNFDLVA